MTFKEELEKLIKENFYDDHENCDDSCGKKADYTELITSIINLVDKVIGEDERHENGKKMVNYWSCDDCGIPEEPWTRNQLRQQQRAKLKGVRL